ncbi:hypothetical protein D3C76_1273050 [compost metagenome]
MILIQRRQAVGRKRRQVDDPFLFTVAGMKGRAIQRPDTVVEQRLKGGPCRVDQAVFQGFPVHASAHHPRRSLRAQKIAHEKRDHHQHRAQVGVAARPDELEQPGAHDNARGDAQDKPHGFLEKLHDRHPCPKKQKPDRGQA